MSQLRALCALYLTVDVQWTMAYKCTMRYSIYQQICTCMIELFWFSFRKHEIDLQNQNARAHLNRNGNIQLKSHKNYELYLYVRFRSFRNFAHSQQYARVFMENKYQQNNRAPHVVPYGRAVLCCFVKMHTRYENICAVKSTAHTRSRNAHST